MNLEATSAHDGSDHQEGSVRAEAVVDLDAIAANIDTLVQAAGTEVMVVVKADAYGHGQIPVARSARESGVQWLGVALPSEAIALRDSGDLGSILAWLFTPGEEATGECVRRDIDLGVSHAWALDEIAGHARTHGVRARVHLKIDTGLGRGGVARQHWSQVVARAAALQAEGMIEVVGVWSHLVSGEVPGADVSSDQARAFEEALQVAEQAGVTPRWRHLGNSGAVLSGAVREWGPPHSLVRCGIAVYGVTPGIVLGEARQLGLRPAMTLRTRLALVKDIPAGFGVSYGHHWISEHPTRIGLLPLGYADGLPRTAVDPQVWVAGHRVRVVGRIAMDQCVVDLGDLPVHEGAPVVVFGPGDNGEPTAEEWAGWAGTIGYEIVTRIGERVPRRYVGARSAALGLH